MGHTDTRKDWRGGCKLKAVGVLIGWPQCQHTDQRQPEEWKPICKHATDSPTGLPTIEDIIMSARDTTAYYYPTVPLPCFLFNKRRGGLYLPLS